MKLSRLPVLGHTFTIRAKTEVLKTHLETQAADYNATFNILILDVKEVLRSVRNDMKNLKTSIQFTRRKFDEAQKKLNAIDSKVSMHSDTFNAVNDQIDSTEIELEYLENQSHHSNIRITRISENKDVEASWSDQPILIVNICTIQMRIKRFQCYGFDGCNVIKFVSEISHNFICILVCISHTSLPENSYALTLYSQHLKKPGI